MADGDLPLPRGKRCFPTSRLRQSWLYNGAILGVFGKLDTQIECRACENFKGVPVRALRDWLRRMWVARWAD